MLKHLTTRHYFSCYLCVVQICRIITVEKNGLVDFVDIVLWSVIIVNLTFH